MSHVAIVFKLAAKLEDGERRSIPGEIRLAGLHPPLRSHPRRFQIGWRGSGAPSPPQIHLQAILRGTHPLPPQGPGTASARLKSHRGQVQPVK